MPVWHSVPTPIGFNAFGQIDPYLDWAFERSHAARRSGGRSAGAAPSVAERRFPLLLCLGRGHTVAQFASGDFFSACSAPADWSSVVHVPAVYRDGNNADPPSYFTALVTERFFDYFRDANSPVAQELQQAISRLSVSREMPPTTYPATETTPGAVTPAPVGAPEQGTVVVGIIDDGIAFANDRFRTLQGRSRVEFAWLQDADYNAAAARYGYGRSLSKLGEAGGIGIDAALQSATHSGLVDEDQVYAALGAQSFGPRGTRTFRTVGLHSTHGTHVTDIACGYAPGKAPRHTATYGEDNRPIVCVQLPAATSEGTSGASLDTYVVDAIRYILDKADEISKQRGCGRLPVVINFSYGTIAGRHDGTADIERAVDELIEARSSGSSPLQVVIPSGNSRLRQCHARMSFPRTLATADAGHCSASATLRWRILPDDRTRSHLEIWLPPGVPDPAGRVRLVVQPPGGTPSPLILDTPGLSHVWGPTPELGMCAIRYAYVPQPTARGMFLVTVMPTVMDGTDTEVGAEPFKPAPSGVWTVTIENLSLRPEQVVEAWIQRDDTRYGHLSFGRQSYFDHADHVRYGAYDKVPALDDASLIRRAGTINPLATGRHAVVVGGFCRSTWLASDYSGEGSETPMAMKGPVALAGSDDSVAHPGVLAAGTRSGSTIILRGTSVAAPLVARRIADLMATGQPADRNAIARMARQQEQAAGAGRPPRPSESRGGSGRLDLPDPRGRRRIDEMS